MLRQKSQDRYGNTKNFLFENAVLFPADMLICESNPSEMNWQQYVAAWKKELKNLNWQRKNLAVMPAGKLGKIYSNIEL